MGVMVAGVVAVVGVASVEVDVVKVAVVEVALTNVGAVKHGTGLQWSYVPLAFMQLYGFKSPPPIDVN